MAFSLFHANPINKEKILDDFNFNYFERFFVENRLAEWVSVGKMDYDGNPINSLNDFFQQNYILVQEKAFLWGLDNLPDTLNFTWISNLHKLATQELKHEDGEDIPQHVRNTNTHLIFPNSIYQV